MLAMVYSKVSISDFYSSFFSWGLGVCLGNVLLNPLVYLKRKLRKRKFGVLPINVKSATFFLIVLQELRFSFSDVCAQRQATECFLRKCVCV